MGASQRSKGQRKEREVINELKQFYPNAHRNWLVQNAVGGSDIASAGCFNWEVKGGKQANIKKVRGWLDQVRAEGVKENWDVVVGNPDREDKYAIIPWDDFMEILEVMRGEGII
jgi:hypothetical protein